MTMLKTHSGAKKRLKKLKGGLFKGAHVGRRKKLTQKSAKRKRALRGKLYIHPGDKRRIEHIMPY
jgi:large subunit ribosomal protein L35